MAQFSPALDFLLDSEDRGRTYAEVIDNNGGKVIAGVNSKSFPVEEAAIAALSTTERAAAVSQFYYSKFWTPMQCGGIVDQDLANRVLDCGVNDGPGTGVKLLQQAVNALHPGSLVVDGHLGPKSLAAVNECDPEAILAAYRQQRLLRYQEVVKANPADAVYLGTADNPGGWWKRATA